MSLHTPLCDLLGVKHPIMLAGMGGVSYAELAAAVSNAGGYGVLGMAGRTPEFIRDEMRKVKSLTDKPFGVDLLAASPESLTASVEIIIEEGASSFVAGLGVPMPIMEKLKKAGLKVMVVCGAVKHAVKAEQAGCDAVICQGGEGGGHTGLVGTMPLVAQAVEAVKIPVVAAGGIADGRGLAAALMLGAAGGLCGTAFYVSAESLTHPHLKRVAVKGSGDDTVRSSVIDVARDIAWPQAFNIRTLRNAFIDEWAGDLDGLRTHREREQARYVKARDVGDSSVSAAIVGEGIDLIHTEAAAGDIVRTMVVDAEARLKTAAGFLV